MAGLQGCNLYRNNGDGTFTRITSGSIVSDGGNAWGCSWADYDKDGDLDLFVANWSGKNNNLYRNDGTTNHWIEVRCVGTKSNWAAIGAKLRVKATLGGTNRWQLREISGGSGLGSQSGELVTCHQS